MTFDAALSKQLLQVAHDVNPPDNIGMGEFEDKVFDHPDGWKVVIFYDCGELDYIDHIVSPAGERFDVWATDPDPRFNHYGEYDFNPLQCWRGTDDTQRLIEEIDRR